MKITTLTGQILDSEKGMAPDLTEYARKKGLNTIDVFFVETEPQTYLIVDRGIPEFASTSAEAIAVHIDILALTKQV